jgi:hypothetical protein
MTKTKSSDSLSKLIDLLRHAYKTRSTQLASNAWDQALMANIRSLPRAAQRETQSNDAVFAPIFLFSFGALLLTLIIQASYQRSVIESAILANSLVQLDPFDISGAFDE